MDRSSNHIAIWLAASAAALTLLLASGAQAATFTVNTSFDADDGSCTTNSGGCTLHEAINAANASPDAAETINFAPDVTVSVDLTSRLPTINGGISIVGPGSAQLNIRRSNIAPAFRIFAASGGGPVSISGLTISNGREEGTTVNREGGGIWSSNVALTLDHVVVTGNTVAVTGSGDTSGGGILVSGGSLVVRDSVVSDNALTATGSAFTSASGGGIRVRPDTSVSIERSTIKGNSVQDASPNPSSEGGGIYTQGTVSVLDSTISQNHAGDGVGPSPGGGGGITNFASTLAVTNSTISNNTADDFGGAIDSYTNAGSPGPTTSLNAVTIADNVANEDGDAFGDGGGTQSGAAPPAGIHVTNTLYYNNFANGPSSGDQCSGYDHISGGYNLRAPGGCGGFNGPGEVTNDDFLLSALGDHGGPTFTFALPAGAPAVNAGNSAAPGSGGPACPATDQRGLYRGGSAGRCDIGAFELGATASPPSGAAPTQPPAARKKCKKKKAKKRAAVAKKKKCKKKRGRR